MERKSGKQGVGDPDPTLGHLRIIDFESRTGGFVPEDERFELDIDETPANPEASGSVTYDLAPDDGNWSVTFQDADS